MKFPSLSVLLTSALLVFLSIATPARAADEEDLVFTRLFRHKQMYFLLGEPNTKVQFSFKLRPITSIPLYFGYSQLIIWDLFKTSRPIRDVNFNPEFFYRLPLGQSGWTVDLGPYEHESNGKSLPESRSWNRAYARFRKSFNVDERAYLSTQFKIWAAYNLEITNDDLLNYRGLYEGEIGLHDFLGPWFTYNELTLRFWPGGKTHINPIDGGRELTLRIQGNNPAFITQLVLQVFEGYGENLLNYDNHVLGFRAGVGF